MRFHPILAVLPAIPLATAQLNELAKEAGKLYFGTATDNGELSNTTYFNILTDTKEFGQLTPANGMKVYLDFRRFNGRNETDLKCSGNSWSPTLEYLIIRTDRWLRT